MKSRQSVGKEALAAVVADEDEGRPARARAPWGKGLGEAWVLEVEDVLVTRESERREKPFLCTHL